jgi:hypothetical protein
MEQQSGEAQSLKDELEAAYERIRSLEEMDSVKEIEGQRERIKEYEEINRSLKLELEQTRYQTDNNQ